MRDDILNAIDRHGLPPRYPVSSRDPKRLRRILIEQSAGTRAALGPRESRQPTQTPRQFVNVVLKSDKLSQWPPRSTISFLASPFEWSPPAPDDLCGEASAQLLRKGGARRSSLDLTVDIHPQQTPHQSQLADAELAATTLPGFRFQRSTIWTFCTINIRATGIRPQIIFISYSQWSPHCLLGPQAAFRNAFAGPVCPGNEVRHPLTSGRQKS